MSKRNVVCYHHNDLDGKSAGWIVYTNNKGDSTANNYHSTTYEDAFNKHTVDDDVYIVDISISEKTYKMFVKACKNAKSVTWIDHHKTSIDLINAHKDEIINIPNLTYFVSEKGCGALLTYVYFKGMKDTSRDYEKHFAYIPEWLKYVDDYDRWCKKYPETDSFILACDSHNTAVTKFDINSGLRVFNTSFWDNVMTDNNVSRLIGEGEIINRYITSRYNRESVDMFEWEYNGTRFLCKNGSGNSWNFGNSFDKYDAVILFKYTGKTGLWLHSVYSDEKSNFNCERFCKRFGGGGHIHASGFSVDKPIMFTMGTVRPVSRRK